MISVVRRKLITSCSSVFTKAPAVNAKNSLTLRTVFFSSEINAHLSEQKKRESLPMTPRLVSRRYSNGRVLLTVCRNG